MVENLLLSRSRQFLLDTSAFIFFLTGIEPYFSLLVPVFRRVQRGEATLLVSAITEAELLVRPERERDHAAIERVGDLLSEDGIYVISVDRRIARRAGRLRGQYGGFKLPDAIIMATALETKCDAVVGRDRAWGKVNELPFVDLDELVKAI